MYRTSSGHQCFLVAIEGPDMVGKATQAQMLEDALRREGYRATTEEIPYDDGFTHPLIYEMLHDGGARTHADTFQALQCLNRIAFWRSYLPTLAVHYDVVILDRWTLSTRVYGEVAGAGKDATETLLARVGDADRTFVLDAPPWPKEGRDSYERDSEFQRRVRDLYGRSCDRSPDLFVKIDGFRPRAEVHGEVARRVLADQVLRSLR